MGSDHVGAGAYRPAPFRAQSRQGWVHYESQLLEVPQGHLDGPPERIEKWGGKLGPNAGRAVSEMRNAQEHPEEHGCP